MACNLYLPALLIALSSGIADAAGYAPQPGERHPALTLPNIENGQPVSLADFRGKKVLLIQFASW